MWSRIIVSGLFVLLAGCAPQTNSRMENQSDAVSTTGDEPILIVDVSSIDLGRLQSNQKVSFSLNISTNGPELKLGHVRASCGCIRPLTDGRPESLRRAQQEFKFDLDTSDQCADQKQLVRVTAVAVDGRELAIDVPVTYYVESLPTFLATPEYAVRFHNEPHYYFTGILFQARSATESETQESVVRNESETHGFAFDSSRVTRIPQGTGAVIKDRFELTLKIEDKKELPNLLKLATGEGRVVEVPVTYVEQSPLVVGLNSLFGGILTKGQRSEKSVPLENQSRIPIEIEDVVYRGSGKLVTRDLESRMIEPGLSFSVPVEFVAEGEVGRNSGELTVTFVDKKLSPVTLPVSWIIKE